MLSIDEALRVSAEARAILSSVAGPEQQTKAKAILDGALEALTKYAAQPADKAEKKAKEAK